MIPISWRHRLFAAPLLPLALLPGSALRGQAALTQITTSASQHVDAKISADGAYVAFRVANQSLGVVGTSTGVENLSYTSATSTLNSYVWSPNSAVLYLVDGTAVKSTNRAGSNVLNLTTVPGNGVTLWTTNSNGSLLYGARSDGVGTAFVFSMLSSGGGLTDVTSAAGVIDEVRLDRGGRFLLFRNWSGLPFTPVQYWSFDLTGPNGLVLLYTSSGTDNVQSGYWLDGGQNIVFTTLSPNVSQLHLGKASAGNPLEMLTDFQYFTRRSYVRPGSAWILCETLAPNVAGVSVAVMPVTGGGQILLEGGRSLFPNAGSFSGGLTIDDNDDKVALCAGTTATDPNPQIYVASLNRELSVSPRLQTGGTFRISLPVAAAEIGAVAVAFGLTSGAPFTLPGVSGGMLLDTTPGNMVSAVSGIGGSGALVGNWAIPANPGLRGFRLFCQGVRLDLNLNGSFTRWGHFVCH